MNQAVETSAAPSYPQLLGHPRPLWMLFMTEFWERFAFYSVSWALALYIVAHFYNGDASGQAWASSIFGAYTALIYAFGIFGGYVADKVIGYQRSILLGALVMAMGLFVVMLPSRGDFPGRPGDGDCRQRAVQAEHLHHGRAAVWHAMTRVAIAASPCSTWASTAVRCWRRC